MGRIGAGGLWLAFTLLSFPAVAGDLRIVPSFGVDEYWTDNAYLAPTNLKPDFITTVSPGLKVDGSGARAQYSVDYNLAYDTYASQTQLDGFRHDGTGLVSAELLKDILFLDARGNLADENDTAVGPTTAADRTASVNRIRVGTYSVTPSLRHRFGPWVLAELSYRHDQTAYLPTGVNTTVYNTVTTFDDAGPFDSVGDGGKLDLRSGEAFSKVLWEYSAQTDRVERAALVFTQTTNILQGERTLTGSLGLLAHAGYDVVTDPQLDGRKYGGVFYGGGLHWRPVPDADIRFEVGERYRGLDLSALASYKLASTTTVKLSQQTGLSTEDEIFADALEVIQRDAYGRFIDPFSGMDATPTSSPFTRSVAVFKLRRTDIALSYAADRDSATLTGAMITRKNLSDFTAYPSLGVPFLVGQKETALTAAAIEAHRLTPTLTGTVEAGWEDVYGSPTVLDNGQVLRAALDLAYAVNPTVTAHVGYHYVDTRPDQGPSISENMISLGVRKSF